MENKFAVDVGLNIWIDVKNETVFCQGRALLLERIREHGSLRKAAKSLGMSYRAAWGKLKQTQEILGCELVTLSSSRPKCYKLTDEGEKILIQYFSWRQRVENLAAAESFQLKSHLEEFIKASHQ